MQLLSVLYKCKIYYLFNYYLEFSNQFYDSYLSTHSIYYYYYFLIIKIYQNHIIYMGIIFFFDCQDHFQVFNKTALFWQSYLYLVQIHTSF